VLKWKGLSLDGMICHQLQVKYFVFCWIGYGISVLSWEQFYMVLQYHWTCTTIHCY
jgi:hypothetical protein